MIAWRKLMRSGQMILPNMIFLAVTKCGCTPPTLDANAPISPNEFTPGTDVAVDINGDGFTGCGPPVIYIDGKINGGGADVWCDFDALRDPHTESDIPVRLHIDPNARGGSHSLAVKNDWGVSIALPFTVLCPGPFGDPPRIDNVISDGGTLRPGRTVTFTLWGSHFLNANPQVQIDGSDVHVVRGPYNLQNFGYDSLDVDIKADPTAAGAVHSVYITTGGCTSNVESITVDASQPAPSPTPGGPPALNSIFCGDVQYPSHTTKFASTDHSVSVGFHGTGFGKNSEIVVDQNNFIQSIGEVFGATNSDTDLTGLISFYLPAGTDSSVRVWLHNLDNDTMSNSVILFLDKPTAGAPVVDTAYFLAGGVGSLPLTEIHRNGDEDLFLQGQNLQGISEQSFSTISGLTFSNVQYLIPAQALLVHVHADANTTLSADEATNLTVTTASGKSNQFWVSIVP